MDAITIERAATAIPVKRRLKFGLKRLALACLAVAVTLGGIVYGRYWWTVGRFIESTDDAYAGGNVTPVAPHVAGFVAQILVADNQYVRAGQLWAARAAACRKDLVSIVGLLDDTGVFRANPEGKMNPFPQRSAYLSD